MTIFFISISVILIVLSILWLIWIPVETLFSGIDDEDFDDVWGFDDNYDWSD